MSGFSGDEGPAPHGEPGVLDWRDELRAYERLIEDKVLSIMEGERGKASRYHPFMERLYRDLEEFILRKGRRLASCSTLIAYRGFKGSIDEGILSVCAGMELYRHSILVHDDLADKDESRRYASTLHKIYAEGYDEAFGGSVALFAGNILYALAVRVIGDAGFEPETSLNVIGMISKAFQDVNESQILDALFEHTWPDPDEWYVMASKRAASLFKAALLIGGTLAKARQDELNLLNAAAEHMGYCFDIQDDIIDTFTTEEQYGRMPGGDIAGRKKPLHIIYAKRMAGEPGGDLLDGIMGRRPSSRELDNVRRLIISSGALDEARRTAKRHAELAKKSISETSMNDRSKAFFLSLIDYIQGSLDWYR
ncbi:polyprenyl synthetase family protein [Candidatus Bathyarchaeota archaeon]|nr:polyprenyl synthetase family protein [Candidatus Bathyarchaeota archaeon]